MNSSEEEPQCTICSKPHFYENDYEECDDCLINKVENTQFCKYCSRIKYIKDLFDGSCWICDIKRIFK